MFKGTKKTRKHRRKLHGSMPRKPNEKREQAKFERYANINDRLKGEYGRGGLALDYYTRAISHILFELPQGKTISSKALRERVGLPKQSRKTCVVRLSLRDVIYEHENDWYHRALSRLEDQKLVVDIPRGDGHQLRLATPEDHARWREAEEKEAREEKRHAAIRTALGKNPAYAADGGRIFTCGAVVRFAGPSLRKLERLLEREGLLKPEKAEKAKGQTR